MKDWNVVATVREDAIRQARQILRRHGRVETSDFFNVLVIEVDDLAEFMEALRDEYVLVPDTAQVLARVLPVTRTFSFQSTEEFETRAREIVLEWLPHLAGKSFYVRLHRRGFKGSLSSAEEERALAEVMLGALQEGGNPGRVTFDDPDLIVDIETVGPQAGLALWTREDLERYPFLRIG